MTCTNFLGRHVNILDKLGPFMVLYYGIGVKRAKIFCNFVGLSYTTNLYSLSVDKAAYLENLVMRVCSREFELRRCVQGNLYFKYSSGSLQGLRLSQGLPANGQRTKTNAKTAKRSKIDFSKFSK